MRMLTEGMRSGKMSDILKFLFVYLTFLILIFRLYQPTNNVLLDDVLKPMKMLKPTGIEFIAIAGHLLWLSPGNKPFLSFIQTLKF